jgi:two-component system OmpR family response regulator
MMATEIRPRRLLRFGNMEIDFDTYRVRVAGAYIPLGLREFDTLAMLVAQPDHIISGNEITQELWQASGRRYSRRLSVMIYRLRAKLHQSDPYSIESVRGRGYGLLMREGAMAGAQRGQPEATRVMA